MPGVRMQCYTFWVKMLHILHYSPFAIPCRPAFPLPPQVLFAVCSARSNPRESAVCFVCLSYEYLQMMFNSMASGSCGVVPSIWIKLYVAGVMR